MSKSFDDAFQFVLKWEGGIVDDANDPGGLTKYGISKRSYPDLDIANLTLDDCKRIYKRDYWIAAACPHLPPPLALLQFDCAVNQGVGRASRILQKSVRAKADGIIGPLTLAAVDRAWERDPKRLLGEYCARRAVHYSSLSLVIRYGLGWFRRLFDAHGAALVLRLEA